MGVARKRFFGEKNHQLRSAIVIDEWVELPFHSHFR
jgi:hypothetical protein